MIAQTCAVLLPNSCNPFMSVNYKTQIPSSAVRQQFPKPRQGNYDSLMLLVPIRLQIPAPENSSKKTSIERNQP